MGLDSVARHDIEGIRLTPVAADSALACLAGKPLAARFSAWRGGSGRRYICTIYPFDPSQPQNGLPPYTDMVVLAVRRDAAGGRDVAGVAAVGATGLSAAGLAALSGCADEWHVHLMAEAPAQRAAAMRDLLGMRAAPSESM